MKIKLYNWRSAKWNKISQWHNHFAWLPVKIDYNDCHWLETVERKLRWTDDDQRAYFICYSDQFLPRYEYRVKGETID